MNEKCIAKRLLLQPHRKWDFLCIVHDCMNVMLFFYGRPSSSVTTDKFADLGTLDANRTCDSCSLFNILYIHGYVVKHMLYMTTARAYLGPNEDDVVDDDGVVGLSEIVYYTNSHRQTQTHTNTHKMAKYSAVFLVWFETTLLINSRSLGPGKWPPPHNAWHRCVVYHSSIRRIQVELNSWKMKPISCYGTAIARR